MMSPWLRYIGLLLSITSIVWIVAHCDPSGCGVNEWGPVILILAGLVLSLMP